MDVKATTKIYGIFGHPVSHSFSPTMHNAAFNALGLNCVYVAFDVHPDELKMAAPAIRSMGIQGINITIPHKQTIIPFLDEVSPEAALMGAVNTVKNKDGRLSGYNTDVGGFIRALREDLGIHPIGLTVTLLGAGGAARAVLAGLCMNGVSKIYVINRTLDRAQKLVSEFRKTFPHVSLTAVSFDDNAEVEASLHNSDLLINSTSAGMKGADTLKLPLEVLRRGCSVYDLVYNPREPALVIEAKELGFNASGGLSMLIYQGAESFEIWTGQTAPVDIMRKVIG